MKIHQTFMLIVLYILSFSVLQAQSTNTNAPATKGQPATTATTGNSVKQKEEAPSTITTNKDKPLNAAAVVKRNEAQKNALANARISAWEGLKEADIENASKSETTTIEEINSSPENKETPPTKTHPAAKKQKKVALQREVTTSKKVTAQPSVIKKKHPKPTVLTSKKVMPVKQTPVVRKKHAPAKQIVHTKNKQPVKATNIKTIKKTTLQKTNVRKGKAAQKNPGKKNNLKKTTARH